MNTIKVRALCFDVFGTVTDWHSSVIAEGERLSDTIGQPINWGEFVTKWRNDGYIAALFKIATGQMECIPTADIHRDKLLQLLEEYNITGLSNAQIEHFNLTWNRLNAWSDAAQGLSMMKEDFLIMPFSNGDFRCLVDIAKHNNLPWDGIISADFFKKVKPEPTIYTDAAKLLCLDPTEIMMVACHARDLQGAQNAGFKTAYVNRPLEYGPGIEPEDKIIEFDAEADDFIQLATKLRDLKSTGSI